MASPAGFHATPHLASAQDTEPNDHQDTPDPNTHSDTNFPSSSSQPQEESRTSQDSTSPPPFLHLDPGQDPTPDSQYTTPTITSTGEILPAITPPYWRAHTRSTSSASAFSLGKPPPIRLEDNTGPDSEGEGIKSPLWARAVAIDGHVVVSGNVGAAVGIGIGDYVVWSCRVGTVDGGSVQLHKRYSEFEALRAELASTFPRAGSSLPVLPPKSVFYRFRPAFLEKRRAGLEYFLNCILLNPEFASSAVLKEFVFS